MRIFKFWVNFSSWKNWGKGLKFLPTFNEVILQLLWPYYLMNSKNSKIWSSLVSQFGGYKTFDSHEKHMKRNKSVKFFNDLDVKFGINERNFYFFIPRKMAVAVEKVHVLLVLLQLLIRRIKKKNNSSLIIM